jgi:hypothetical protein
MLSWSYSQFDKKRTDADTLAPFAAREREVPAGTRFHHAFNPPARWTKKAVLDD